MENQYIHIDGSGYANLWYVTDYQGNVRSVVKLARNDTEDNTILEQNDYLPYGTRLTRMSTSSLDNRFRYAGKEEQFFFDDEHPLLDFGARIYDPSPADGSRKTRKRPATPPGAPTTTAPGIR